MIDPEEEEEEGGRLPLMPAAFAAAALFTSVGSEFPASPVITIKSEIGIAVGKRTG